MNTISTTSIRFLLVLLTVSITATACSYDYTPKRDPYNDPDAQRDRSKEAQREMSRDY